MSQLFDFTNQFSQKPNQVLGVSVPMKRLLLSSVLAWCACSGAPTEVDAGLDAGPGDSGIVDAGTDAGVDAGVDAGLDAGEPDGGTDAGQLLGPGSSTQHARGYPSRPYDLQIPQSYDGTPLPVIVLLHGGGGNPTEAEAITCPGGDAGSPECFLPLADARHFIVVSPSGTQIGPTQLRAWNSGGGDGGWQCVSSKPCTDGVDEKAYFTAVFDDLGQHVHFDAQHIYATGHSNGAAMSERLACEFPLAVKAIASVAGGNQYSTTQPCPAQAAVLELHGTADPCWEFDGGPASCADKNMGSKISVPQTIAFWQAHNGCTGGETVTPVPDTADDGTSSRVHRYDCPKGKEVVLVEILDGGHTWPGGSTTDNGLTSHDFSGSKAILDFFQAH